MWSSTVRYWWITLLMLQIAGHAHAATVKLAWDPNTETDLAGYNVYRSQTSGSGYTRLNGALVLSPSYNDATAVVGQTYFYVVTAVNTFALESGNSNEVTTTVAGPPDLAITKAHSGNFTVGINGLYTFTVTNVGSGASSGTTTVTDNLPVGLSFVSGGGTGWSFAASGQTVTCINTGSIAAGASSVFTLTVGVGAAAVPAVTNVAAVSNSGDLNAANNNASDPTTVTQPPLPDLTILKSHAGSFTVGVNGSYALTVSNVGTAASSGTITVTDTLPVGLSFVSGAGTGWNCTAVGQVVTCTNTGSIAAGGNSAITLTVSVGGAAVPTVTNTAAVSNPGDVNSANNGASDPTSVSQPPGLPDLWITKSHSGNFTVGVNGIYTLTVNNVGTATSSGTITVTDNLPAGLSLVSGTGTGWTCSAAGQTVTCTNTGTIAAGANTVITLTVSVGAAAFPAVTNTAAVSNPSDVNAANNSASDLTTVIQKGFFTVTPCRVLDTRNPTGPFGGPALAANATRNFTISGRCGIPSTARAVSINMTVTASAGDGHLGVYPAGTPLPMISSINYVAGKTRANNGVISLGVLGDIAVRCVQPSGTAHFIVDVNGYFQ